MRVSDRYQNHCLVHVTLLLPLDRDRLAVSSQYVQILCKYESLVYNLTFGLLQNSQIRVDVVTVTVIVSQVGITATHRR